MISNMYQEEWDSNEQAKIKSTINVTRIHVIFGIKDDYECQIEQTKRESKRIQ